MRLRWPPTGMLSRIYRKLVEEVRLQRSIGNAYWLKKLKYFGLTSLDVSVSPAGELFLESLRIKLTPETHLFMLEGYRHARELTDIGAVFRVDEHRRIQVALEGLTVRVFNKQELFILSEIFVKQCYNYRFPEASLVVDIGFNVGFSALYFAQNSHVDHVYAFEPFAKTFEQGRQNLAMNPAVEGKITPHSFGLGASDDHFVAQFDSQKKGNNSAKPLVDEAEGEVETIELKCITRVFESLGIMTSDKSLVIKMDCEGGEYDLVEQMDTDGILSGVDVLMIEWHVYGPEAIDEVLQRNGFRVFSVRESSTLGFLYAVRNGHQTDSQLIEHD